MPPHRPSPPAASDLRGADPQSAAVADGPSLTQDGLTPEALAVDAGPWFFAAADTVVQDPAATETQLLAILQNPVVSEGVVRRLTQRPVLSPAIQSAIVARNAPGWALSLAESPAPLEPEVLMRLVDCSGAMTVLTRKRVLERADLPPAVIARLLDSPEFEIRRRAASHPAAPAEVLVEALGDRWSQVRERALLHPTLPPSAAAVCVDDDDLLVRAVARAVVPDAAPETVFAIVDVAPQLVVRLLERQTAATAWPAPAYAAFLASQHDCVRIAALRAFSLVAAPPVATPPVTGWRRAVACLGTRLTR